MNVITEPSPDREGSELKIGLLSPAGVAGVVVFVTCVNAPPLNRKISGFPSALLPVRLRVETKAIVFPLSLIVASRLSSAMYGENGAPLLAVPPGEGARLAGVVVIRVNVPPDK